MGPMKDGQAVVLQQPGETDYMELCGWEAGESTGFTRVLPCPACGG